VSEADNESCWQRRQTLSANLLRVGRQRQEPTQDDARSLARWENEGGASKRDPTQKTPKALDIPVPKPKDVLGALRRIARAEKKAG
jgi:hypothetical protein